MEVLTIFSISIKLARQCDMNKRQWIYCVIRAGDQAFCSKTKEIVANGWCEILPTKDKYEIQIPKSFCLFKLQIWDYDSELKLGQVDLTANDLPSEEKQKQFSFNDKKISANIIYERKARIQQARQNEINTMRVSYNKSDPNLKLSSKPNTGYVRKINNPLQEIQTPKFDSNIYAKWRVIPSRNDPSFKLRL